MAKVITVNPIALLHESGSKFYEILTFANHDAGRFVEMRRWGKVAQLKAGGGQISVIEHPRDGSMADSAAGQIRAKTKGGYKSERSTHAFHANAGDHGVGQILSGLRNHYADDNDRATIRVKLGLAGTFDDGTSSELGARVEEVAVDRGEQWGSW